MPDTMPPVSTLADLASFGECSRWKARIRDEGRYTPPSLRGSISWPATVGGVEWGGGAVDPTTNTYVVNSRRGAAGLHPGPARTKPTRSTATRSAAPTAMPRNRVRPYGFTAAELPQHVGHALLGAALRHHVVL